MGEVPGFQLQGEVAGVADGCERRQAGGEIGVAVADAEVDVPRHGVAQVDVGDPAPMTLEVVQRILAGRHDMAEVHDDPDAGAGQPPGQQFRALQVPAEPQEVQ